MLVDKLLPEEIKKIDIVQLACIEDFSAEFKDYYQEEFKPFMKKGWRTWTERQWLDNTQDGILILESNFYKINFPRENFIVLDN